uniref:Translation initiation factor IF-1, chloroplastic n=2 Tax=Selaginella TaxID=3246 RepID=A0A650FH57_9TRAC|nr:translational initiation factor 1 [Selaginella sanguinolenta]QBL76341.1 translational initiation factor 1 [Selaginella sanguinolenta]QGU93171.1 translational initiation factor 1 [Selaginella rossii]
MKRRNLIETEGVVTEPPPNAMPRVCLDNGCQVPTHVPGRIRRNYIRTPPGDRAKAELSPHDSTKGRTIHRPRTKASNGDQVQ